MDDLLHYEDIDVGQVDTFGVYEVTTEEVRAFAAEFDPQPFHLDEAAGAASIAGAMSASGWHTISMCMRMMCDGYLKYSASMGSFGVDEVKWVKPVFPGETLHMRREVLDKRISSSRPEMGILKLHWQAFNQDDELKLDMTGIGLFKVREAQP